MSRTRSTVIEYRDYDLPMSFPVLLLTGEHWRISDVPSKVLHFHNCMELGICESDSGTLEMGNQQVAFSEGDVTLIGTDVPHTTYSDPHKASKWTYVFFDPKELLGPYYPTEVYISELEMADFDSNVAMLFHSKENPVITELAHLIVHELTVKEEGYEHSIRGLILAFLVKLWKRHKELRKDSKDYFSAVTKKDHLVIAPALEYIRINYMQDFPIDKLAELCGLSTTHFRRLFNSMMGDSPLAYLNRFRIHKASILLRTTEHPVLEISEEVGFHSISSFNRHFTRIIGQAPLQWRKENPILSNHSIKRYTGWMTPEKAENESSENG